MTHDTPNGRIITHGCPVSPEMAAAADECFRAYQTLNEKLGKFDSLIPEGFSVKNFYGKGDCVIIDTNESIQSEAKYWEENS